MDLSKYFKSYLFHYTAMSIQLFQSYVTKTFKPFTRPGVIPITKLFKQLHLPLSFKFPCTHMHSYFAETFKKVRSLR